MHDQSNILIIDDEDKLRGLLGRLISLEGFKVIEAPDAKSAFKKLQQESFHVIICDVKLPDANGIEVTQGLSENKITALVNEQTEKPLPGLPDPSQINVLKLNIELNKFK